MQFLTATIVSYIRVLFLLWLAFMLLKNPLTIAHANVTNLLGQAMRLPLVKVTPANPLYGILSMFLTSLALTDLIALLSENTAFLETFVPVRLMFNFLLGGFCILSDYGLVANNLTFTFAFIEIWLNFLIYNNLKDEKYNRVKTYLEEHGDEIRKVADDQIVPL